MPQADDAFSTDLNEFLAKIKRWYATDHEGFKTMYDAAVENVVPYPANTPPNVQCDWKKKDIDFLCNFFTEWHKWQSGTDPEHYAGVNNGLDYIEKFSWINYENDYGMVFVTCGPGLKMTADFTNLQGMQMDAPESKILIERWIEDLGPKRMADYKIEKWKNFNEFFIREIVPGKRPIDAKDDDSVVTAPADCVINMIVDELTDTTPIPVKTVTMNVRQLLNDSEYADRFVYTEDAHGQKKRAGGTAVSCILMPDTYHRYHAPVTGEVVEARDDIGGVYYGMRDFPELLNKGNVGYGYDYEMFDHFRRGYVIIKTKYLDAMGKPDGEGYVGLVPVGLNSIASVNFLKKFKGPIINPVPVKKGEEIGNFKYGGSLNILLFEHGRFPALQLLQGQRIGVLQQLQRTEGLFTGSYHTQSRRLRSLTP
ncbi:phosphatidylserine decarboxylase [Streptomyces zagrosensis]|uniref:Phosphatidylserine decarboxylase n=1 Tax=Streptomyces zagrosensis TaxID=1042984 RepID=A0A7W9QC91_9ACTN|nr:phosphatidylserine decarboxylase [Streptomyces zagrosensis]MBB5936367.1 phosphatidylserine decarboxylase [Streptomyces zagrosensis]